MLEAQDPGIKLPGNRPSMTGAPCSSGGVKKVLMSFFLAALELALMSNIPGSLSMTAVTLAFL